MTLQVQLVLRVLLDQAEREVYGLEIVDATGLPPGTIYPIMARLESAGWVGSRWEQADEHADGRPRRRYYTLTGDGLTAARAALSAADARRRRLRPSAGTGIVLPGGAA
jgi:DNA-binding PadR family transcriptional regulator